MTLYRHIVRVGYTKDGTKNIDMWSVSGLWILASFFYTRKTKVDFYIATKYSYFKFEE